MAMVMPRSFSSGALSIWSKATYLLAALALASTLVMAAVRVVLPWSMCPIVPTFTCGFVRSNFCLAIALLLPAPCHGHGGPDAVGLFLRSCPVCAGTDRGYSPCARAMISLEIDSGTWLYEWNCIVYVARPWVRERRSVE